MNIHKIKDDTVQSVYYTLSGHEDFLDSEGNPVRSKLDNSVYAKALKNKPPKAFKANTLDLEAVQYSYYVKASPNRILVNPIKTFAQPVKKANFIDSVCKNKELFIQVNKAIFDKYLNFLRTQNMKWLTDAQREIK
jgi:hypothetical protein